MDALPVPRFARRPFSSRKRRRTDSAAGEGEGEGTGKMFQISGHSADRLTKFDWKMMLQKKDDQLYAMLFLSPILGY